MKNKLNDNPVFFGELVRSWLSITEPRETCRLPFVRTAFDRWRKRLLAVKEAIKDPTPNVPVKVSQDHLLQVIDHIKSHTPSSS